MSHQLVRSRQSGADRGHRLRPSERDVHRNCLPLTELVAAAASPVSCDCLGFVRLGLQLDARCSMLAPASASSSTGIVSRTRAHLTKFIGACALEFGLVFCVCLSLGCIGYAVAASSVCPIVVVPETLPPSLCCFSCCCLPFWTF